MSREVIGHLRDLADYTLFAHFGEEGDYAETGLLTDWYKRNIRIFTHVLRILASSPAREATEQQHLLCLAGVDCFSGSAINSWIPRQDFPIGQFLPPGPRLARFMDTLGAEKQRNRSFISF